VLNPYFLMTLLFAALAGLAAVDASAASLNLLPWFNGLRWLRVHFITLGLFVEVAFGILPGLVAARSGRPNPKLRWDIWLALNAGLITLAIGVPLANAVLMAAGGTLVFAAAAWLWGQVRALSPTSPARGQPLGRPFYLAGLGFLLVGIIAGTGLWLGWGEALGMVRPKEVHLHANLWGFTSLMMAGLIVDLYAGFAGRPLAWPRSVPAIFWLLVIAGLGLLAAPWLGVDALTAPSLILHHLATAGLVLNLVRPLLGDRAQWTAGLWHLVAGYLWILAPLVAAPLVMLSGAALPAASLEASAPPLLVYGWLLQFALAVVPYLFARLLLPGQPARLGGTWLSLLLVHLGGLFYVPGIFIDRYQALLQGIGFACWAVALLPVGAQMWRLVQAGWARWESQGAAPPVDGLSMADQSRGGE